jgi:hypothetical protein
MPKIMHTDAENRWHAEIFYSLFKESVTLAELQEMAAQVRLPVTPLRHAKIRRILDKHGAIDQLLHLATRCAMVPEVLMPDRPTDDLESALLRRQLLCATQDLMVEGHVERKGPRTFGLTEMGAREMRKVRTS